MRRIALALSCVLLCCALGSSFSDPPGQTAVLFNRDIRPILAENCFPCHGPDSAARKADLRLDLREAAITAGAIVPSKSTDSSMIERITSDEPGVIMPPPKTHKKLTAGQKEILKRWIDQGAEYQPHWSFITPTRPTGPTIRHPQSPIRNPIDSFIVAKLHELGVSPAPEADRRTLARRLSLDLIGLPPDPADVEAFVSDTSPNWYEKYVDKLMASPHWGEHRGRYWLDAARYADTHGIHFDNYREMWSYRDWVIKAFNRNMPFDQFTIEQLAGDLLPDATLDQKVATGFNRCNITSNEGGAIDEEYLVLYTRDRTETTAQVWLGLTAGCAVCHDHKFDPLTQREFYSMAAFFNNTPQKAMDQNIHDTPPVLPVPPKELQARWEQVVADQKAVRARLEERRRSARPDFDSWTTSADATSLAARIPQEGMDLHLPLNETHGGQIAAVVRGHTELAAVGKDPSWYAPKDGRSGLNVKPGNPIVFDDVGDFDRDRPFSAACWVRRTNNSPNGALLARMDEKNGYRGWDVWIQDQRVGSHVIHHWPDDAIKAVGKTPLALNKWQHVAVTYDGSGTVGGLRIFIDGEPQPADVEAAQLKSTTRTTVPFKIGQRNNSSGVQNLTIRDVRIYGRLLTPIDVVHLAKTTRAAELLNKSDRTPAELDELYSWWLTTNDGPYRDAETKMTALRKEEADIRGKGTVAHVMQEKPATAMAFVLHRGEYDQRREEVKPDTPSILPRYSNELPKNRLGFAKWLLAADNPLTARVTVNRFWQEVFGSGLVRTAGDFGTTGELPSHPELLDWLAIEFRESGWDVKKFFKLLVTSATYRQSAAATPEKIQKDPSNRWLSRGPRFRMDAEMIRDQALAASGLLVPKIGGPSVKPYQPEGVWEAVAMIGSNTRDYKRDAGENLYRRSLYTFWKRAAPPASLDILNAPNRETCAVRRERTNTPLQALVTLNDVQFVEAARRLAESALQQRLTEAATIDWICVRMLARPLRPSERELVGKSLEKLLAHYRQNEAEAIMLIAVGESKPDAKQDPVWLAAWTMLCNEFMNLDEALNK